MVAPLALLLLMGGACTTTSDNASGPRDTLRASPRGGAASDCSWMDERDVDPLENVSAEVTCGELETDDNVVIRYVVLHATGDTVADDAVMYLEGGPGGMSIEGLALTSFAWADILESRDIIVWDQRGVGYSSEISCDDPDGQSDEAMVVPDDPMTALDAAREAADDDPFLDCADAIAQDGIDFTDYDSQANASDAMALMDELDYERYNLVGVSYGTRLALSIVRDYPDAPIRSVVLDSVYPLEIDGTSSEVWASERAALRAVDDCTANADCAAAYPNLRARLDALLAQLATQAVDSDEGPIGPRELADALRTVADDGTVAIWIPLMIQQLELRNPEFVLAAINGELGAEDDDTIVPPESSSAEEVDPDEAEVASINSFILYTVECRDETLHNSWDAAVTQWRQVQSPAIAYDGLASAARDLAACERWPTEASAAELKRPVVSKLPTMIFVGVYDAQTPPEWGDVAAASLSKSQLVVFPQMAHAPTLVSWCAASILAAFINDPAVPTDQSCIAATVRPYERP